MQVTEAAWIPAAALIQPLAWELPYPPGAALKSKKKKKKGQKNIAVVLAERWAHSTHTLAPGSQHQQLSGWNEGRPLSLKAEVPGRQ